MNILVTGANGQLGMELREASKSSDDHYIFSDINILPGFETLSLDVTDPGAIGIICKSEKVDIIINCAAYTSVDKAESDIAMADMLNHKAVGYLSACAKEYDILLIHISTDYIFSGEKCLPYTEQDTASPLGVYGVTKLAGERSVLDSGCRYMIFRTAWMYSGHGHNFVRTILKLISEKDTIKVVSDQIGSPTSAADLAGAIFKIVSERNLEHTGIYNYTDEGVASWYDFAVAINEMAGGRCEVLPCSSGEYPTAARRPHYSVLDKKLVRSTFGIRIPYWRESLARCIAALRERT